MGNLRVKYPIASFGAILFTIIYIFFYQLQYPFGVAILLYIAFGFYAIVILHDGKLKMDKQVLLFLAVIVVSLLGLLYTDNSADGGREAILMIVMLVILWGNKGDLGMNAKLVRVIHGASFIVLAGIYLQYMMPDTFNAVMESVLRSDCYEQLMWSLQVDEAYAGFSAYTVDAAFFAAIIFGLSFMKLFGFTNRKSWAFIVNIVVTIMSVFAVLLTSKRGIAVGMILGVFGTMIVMRTLSPHASRRIALAIVVAVVLGVVLFNQNEIARNFVGRFTSSDDITTGRSVMYTLALSKLRGLDLLFGFGTGATYSLFDSGLHNIYLQLLYDHGLFGLIPYLAFFVYNLYLAYRANAVDSLYVQLVMLIYGMSGNPIYSNSIFIVYLCYVACMKEKIEFNEIDYIEKEIYKESGSET